MTQMLLLNALSHKKGDVLLHNTVTFDFTNEGTWSPTAWRPIVMGFFQVETIAGIFRHIMASRKTVPPSMFRIVPSGDFHICFRLNSTCTDAKPVSLTYTLNCCHSTGYQIWYDNPLWEGKICNSFRNIRAAPQRSSILSLTPDTQCMGISAQP